MWDGAKWRQTVAVGAGSGAQRILLVNAAAGTSIVINASGAGGIAWLTLWELDAPA